MRKNSNLRHLLIVLPIIVLLFSALAFTAFADEDVSKTVVQIEPSEATVKADDKGTSDSSSDSDKASSASEDAKSAGTEDKASSDTDDKKSTDTEEKKPDEGKADDKTSTDTKPEDEKTEPEIFTVSFYEPDGKTIIKQVAVAPGKKLADSDIPAFTESGLKIGAWLNDKGKSADLAAKISADTAFTADCIFGLNSADHIAYIAGYSDYTFRPSNSMTRAEAAQMLSRLLILKGKPSSSPSFSDVKNQWFASAVKQLSSLGIILGYEDGTFGPDGNITRAEFVTMLCRFFQIEKTKNPFSDVKSGKYYTNAVAYASSKGWVQGYKDGKFLPNNQVTRAEAVTIINRILERTVDEALWKNTFSTRQCFIDITPKDWCAIAVTEASVAHKYSKGSGKEKWSSYTAPSGLKSGLRAVSGGLTIVDINGFFVIQKAGLVQNGQKYYHVSNAGIFIDKAPKGPVSYSDGLYCGDGTGAVMINADYKDLHFGKDGKYSCGNAELDKLIEDLISKATKSSMTRDEKLRACYLYMRDSGKFSYMAGPHHGRGTTDWAEDAALSFLKNSKGNCYGWAATFTYIARQLGYDAYVVSGGVPRNNSDHAWTMINWSDGNTYLFDIELEWGFMYGRYAKGQHFNFYKVIPSKAPTTYYFP